MDKDDAIFKLVELQELLEKYGVLCDYKDALDMALGVLLMLVPDEGN